jgi:hypothetical protein
VAEAEYQSGVNRVRYLADQVDRTATVPHMSVIRTQNMGTYGKAYIEAESLYNADIVVALRQDWINNVSNGPIHLQHY